jgi:transposase-like protein
MSEQKQDSAELKMQVVLEVLKGQKSLAQICWEYNVTADLVNCWRDTFLERAPLIFADRRVGSKGSGEAQRIAELERMVERLTRDLDAAKKVLELLPP